MKLKSDPRHIKRIDLMRFLFTWQFQKGKAPVKISEVVNRLDEIDELIRQSAPDRPTSQINKIDLAILRLAIFELIINKEPPKVVIDEAVELGKEFGADSSSGFINGVLGKVVQLKGIKTNANNK
mgnify:CR=1 FL=1